MTRTASTDHLAKDGPLTPGDDRWNALRDGELSGSDAQALHQQIAADATLQSHWQAESQWIGVLEAERDTASHQNALLTADLLARFSSAREQTAAKQSRRRRSALFAIGWSSAAAAVAFFIVINQDPSDGSDFEPINAAGNKDVDPLPDLIETVNDHMDRWPDLSDQSRHLRILKQISWQNAVAETAGPVDPLRYLLPNSSTLRSPVIERPVPFDPYAQQREERRRAFYGP